MTKNFIKWQRFIDKYKNQIPQLTIEQLDKLYQLELSQRILAFINHHHLQEQLDNNNGAFKQWALWRDV